MSNKVELNESRTLGLHKLTGVDFDGLKTLFENDPGAFWAKRQGMTQDELPDSLRSKRFLGLQEQIDTVCQKASDPLVNLTALTDRLVESLGALGTAMTYYHRIASSSAAEYSSHSRESALARKSKRQLDELQLMVAAIRKLQQELQSKLTFNDSAERLDL